MAQTRTVSPTRESQTGVFCQNETTRRQAVPSNDHATSLLLNVVWLIFAGWWLAIHHIALAVVLALTIIGIPFAIQHVKLAVLSLTPVGRAVVPL
jgi:uncharacterized membrane protein YccF (DUF307 family)